MNMAESKIKSGNQWKLGQTCANNRKYGMPWIGDMCFFAAWKKRSATEIWISFDSRWLRAVLGWPSIGGSPLFGAEKRWQDSLPFFICFSWLQQHAWLENTRSMFKSHWQHDCMVDGSWTYSLIPKIPVGTCSSFKPWLGLWEICTGSREFDRKISGRPADLPLNQFCNLDGSGMIWIYLSPKGCFFVFFRCSWVSLIFSSWSKPSEKESMVLSWKSGMTSGWNEAFLHCNRMFNYKPSILGYLRYLHLWKPPNLLKHSTTRRIWRGRWDFCSVPLLGESRGSEIPLPGSAICRFQICHGLSRQLS